MEQTELRLFEDNILKPKKRGWLKMVSESLTARLLASSLFLGTTAFATNTSHAEEPVQGIKQKTGLSLSDVRTSPGFGRVYKFAGEPYKVEYKRNFYHAYPLINRTIEINGNVSQSELLDQAELKNGWVVVDKDGRIVFNRYVFRKAAYAAHMGRAIDSGLLTMLDSHAERMRTAYTEATRVENFTYFARDIRKFLAGLVVAQGARSGAEIVKKEVKKHAKREVKKVMKREAEKELAKDILSESMGMVAGKTVDIVKSFGKERQRITDDESFRIIMNRLLGEAFEASRHASGTARIIKLGGTVPYENARVLGNDIVDSLTYGHAASVGLLKYHSDPMKFIFHEIAIPIAEGAIPGEVGMVVDIDKLVKSYPPALKEFRVQLADVYDFAQRNYTEKAVDDSVAMVLGELRSLRERMEVFMVDDIPLRVDLDGREGEIFKVIRGNVDNDPQEETVVAINTYDPSDTSWITRHKGMIVVAERNGSGYDTQQVFYAGFNDIRSPFYTDRCGFFFRENPIHPNSNRNTFRLVDLDNDGISELSIILRIDKPERGEDCMGLKEVKGFTHFALYHFNGHELVWGRKDPRFLHAIDNRDRFPYVPEDHMLKYRDLNGDGVKEVICLYTSLYKVPVCIIHEKVDGLFQLVKDKNKYDRYKAIIIKRGYYGQN